MKLSSIPKSAVSFLKEAKDELTKVVWPTKKELYRHTIVVIGISLSTALVLGVFDLLFRLILEKLI